MSAELSAEQYIARLEAYRTPEAFAQVQEYVKIGKGKFAEGGEFIGVRMQDVFGLADQYVGLPLDEIEKLLVHPVHEVRAGALRIMGKQATAKKTPDSHRQELYDLYLRHSDRINNWDLVDISSHSVVGGYLLRFGKPRSVLYELARSAKWWERRIAMLSTLPFIKVDELDDTFNLAEMLVDDEHHFVHTVVGWMLREAGKHDRDRLLRFLDKHAATAPRILLRYAIEHLDKPVRAHYLNLKRASQA